MDFTPFVTARETVERLTLTHAGREPGGLKDALRAAGYVVVRVEYRRVSFRIVAERVVGRDDGPPPAVTSPA